MEWISGFLFEHSAIQAVVIVAVIISIGLALGRLHIAGISLGVTFVFFTGILAGYLGLSIDPDMLNYAESFGLVLFVYALGLQVGPGFFSSFRKEGVSMNIAGLILIVLGSLMAVGISWLTGYGIDGITGVLCGATTNTPALAAAQQTLKQLGIDAGTAALGCAVTYPFGVVGVIFVIIILRKFFVKPDDLKQREESHADQTYVATFQITNPGISGHRIHEVQEASPARFIISRLWRGKEFVMPNSEEQLNIGDRIMVITTEKDIDNLTLLFGEKEDRDWNHHVNWNKIDRQIVSRHIIVSRPDINGKRLGSLKLRNTFGITVSRVLRSGVKLLATPDLVLQIGDRLTVVGNASDIESVEKVIGNSAGSLKEPNLAVIFIGGFSSLSLELVVMRQLSGFVGSTAVTASIIIGILLAFMSVGYYRGSVAPISKNRIRQNLSQDFIIIALMSVLASSYILIDIYFMAMNQLHIRSNVVQTFIYSLLMLSM